MKAVLWTQYGSPDGLKIAEIARPVPKDNEVLIRVCATSVTAGDSEVRSLRFPFWLALPMRIYMGPIRPRNIILGQELAGQVAAVGKDVTRFQVGDDVFGTTGFRFGAYAEYICLPEESDDAVLALKPTTMSFEEAAVVPTAALEALHFLRKGNLQPGEKVLINGAGGSIGTFAVQLAKTFGAHVVGVDSAEKLDMVRAIGADAIVDYTKGDFSQSAPDNDIVLDVVGKNTYARCMRALKDNGRYLLANPRLTALLRSLWTSLVSSKKAIMGTAIRTPEDLEFLKALIEAGKLRSVIDRVYPLEQAAEAHRYVETGQKSGNVAIRVASPAGL